MWISLGQARHGVKEGDRFRDALDFATYASANRLAMFPLSAGHYYETWKQRRGDRRRRLGELMSEVSRHRTIAGYKSIVDAEIDAALRDRFATPTTPRTVDLFGYGVAHAFDDPRLRDYREVIKQFPNLAGSEMWSADRWETEILCGPLQDLPFADIAQPDRSPAQSYAQSEKQLAAAIAGARKTGADQDGMIACHEIWGLLPVLVPALQRAGLSFEDLAASGADGLTAFLLALPWRGAVLSMRRQAHREGYQNWNENDLNDVAYLGLGVAYCDILVAEKAWARRIRDCKLDERYEIIVIDDLQQLPRHLV